jgi:hypothetical protein
MYFIAAWPCSCLSSWSEFVSHYSKLFMPYEWTTASDLNLLWSLSARLLAVFFIWILNCGKVIPSIAYFYAHGYCWSCLLSVLWRKLKNNIVKFGFNFPSHFISSVRVFFDFPVKGMRMRFILFTITLRLVALRVYLITLIHLLTHSLSSALLEKLPIVQPLKNFPAFYGTRRFITAFTRALHWSLS